MRTLAAALILVAFGGCAVLTAEDKAAIASDASTIAGCQAVGQRCKADGGAGCYGRYDECMKEAGLH